MNWYNRKLEIDDIYDDPKISMLTLSMYILYWCSVRIWMSVFFADYMLHTAKCFSTNSCNLGKHDFALSSHFVLTIPK